MDDHGQARSADVRKLLLATFVLGLFTARSGQAQSQPNAAGANASKFGVAVIDVGYIFKNYPRFNQAMEAMNTEMKSADGQLKADRDKLAQMEDQRNALKPGAPEFKKIDEDLAREKANFTIKQGTLRRDFMEREAKIIYQTYMELTTALKYYTQQHEIGVVVQFRGDPVDPNQQDDIRRAMMQPVIFQNAVDITPDVLGMLMQGVPAAQSAARPGQAAPR